MKIKLAGLILGMGMSLAAQADTYHFTPIVDPNNTADLSLLVTLGERLSMDVTYGGNNTTWFTFTNDAGSMDSVITRIYFDDSPSNLFSNFTIDSDSGSNVQFSGGPASALPGGSIPTFSFGTTNQFNATHPHPFMGINNASASSGEFLRLAATLNAGKSFADVINSLNAGDETNGNYLRVGLRVTSIDEFNDGGMSYLDKSGGGGGSPPPPVPEPETYGLLLAGLGLVGAMARRRRSPA